MKIAVIETGGKQYLVKPQDKIQIEKVAGKEGDKVKFDKVLLVADGDKVEVGKPYVSGKAVEAKVLGQSRDRKILVMKFKNKVRYKRKKGHRQHHTTVEIASF